MCQLSLQPQRVSASVLHPSQQDRKENFQRAQKTSRNQRSRFKSEIRQIGPRVAHIWGPFLFSQGKNFQPKITKNIIWCLYLCSQDKNWPIVDWHQMNHKVCQFRLDMYRDVFLLL